jgi:hypothetical protein
MNRKIWLGKMLLDYDRRHPEKRERSSEFAQVINGIKVNLPQEINNEIERLEQLKQELSETEG